MTPENGLSVIITGGASGIGAATARRIVADGGHVGLVDIDDNRAEALSGGLWGPGKAWRDLPGRIGDVVLLMRGARTVFYPHRAKSRVSHVVGGRHGGLHEREMLVPLFCSKL